MTELVPGTVEASHEKHIPVVRVEGDTVYVNVGSVEHPMSEEHSILWVYLETDKGGKRRELAVGEPPRRQLLSQWRKARCGIRLLQSPRTVEAGDIIHPVSNKQG